MIVGAHIPFAVCISGRSTTVSLTGAMWFAALAGIH
jgi:hypothetical protein